MRKGLTEWFARRMRNTVPRAVALARAAGGRVKLSALMRQESPLQGVAEAFARAERRAPGVVEAVVTPSPRIER